MALIDDLRLRVRWTWHRATFVAQTEGVATLIERTATMLGITAKHVDLEELLTGPPLAPLGRQSALAWPPSLLVLPAEGAGEESLERGRQLVGLAHRLDVPAHLAEDPADLAAALQLSSMLIVLGPSAWPAPTLVTEARRLRLGVVVALAPQDAGHHRLPAIISSCDSLIVPDAATGAAAGGSVPVHVIPADQEESTVAALDVVVSASHAGAAR